MIEFIISFLSVHWLSVISLLTIASLVKNYHNHGLQKYPGPFLASFTDWWRFFDVLGRRPDITQNRLHKQHGDIVRLGPNCLSFANPDALKTIYGLHKGFTKARISLHHDKAPIWLTSCSPLSTQYNKQCPKGSACPRSSQRETSSITHSFADASTVLSQ